VVYNLAPGSNIVVTGATNRGIDANKNTGTTGNIYIRSAGLISDGSSSTSAGFGIRGSNSSSGNMILENDGTILKGTGIRAQDGGPLTWLHPSRQQRHHHQRRRRHRSGEYFEQRKSHPDRQHRRHDQPDRRK
jgi:hypothetical protein